ncbi:NAD-dependent epimerase/dehydratase family protein [Candidatus Falkowbacteria bacterium]|nr:NAD-dependent epimerase/dehydratase family protein [Candidatus Falkowbacteria bacterium]
MKILITGGLGFQGSHLTKHFLDKGHDVTVLNTYSEHSENHLDALAAKPRVVWGSVTDKELVRKTVRDHDVIFHLAANINVDESIKLPYSFVDVNVYGTMNVLEAVREFGGRLIYASTCEVYGVNPGMDLLNEDAPLKPHSPYAATKAAADRLCYAYFKTYNLDVAVVRPFNIFGEGQKDGQFGALIPIMVRRALHGENLQVFGSGSQTRDYMYIQDLISAYDMVMETQNSAGQVYNFGTGVETSVRDIAEYIAKKMGVTVEYTNSRPGEVSRFCADLTKAKGLGFTAKFTIWEGIDNYIAWKKVQKNKA